MPLTLSAPGLAVSDPQLPKKIKELYYNVYVTHKRFFYALKLGNVVYLGAGIRAWTAMRKRSMMKEQTRLVLNVSSLIWENWNTRNNCYLEV